jgi:hypothetical protein
MVQQLSTLNAAGHLQTERLPTFTSFVSKHIVLLVLEHIERA